MMRARGPSRRSLGWSEYLSVTLRADRGYNGVLTLNPAWPGPEYETSYLRAWPWELRELGEIIPDGWRIPAVPATAIGRNVALFKWAVKEAHRPAAGARYSLRQYDRERFRELQRARASKVNPDSERQRRPWEALGVSRRTYYRRKFGTIAITGSAPAAAE